MAGEEGNARGLIETRRDLQPITKTLVFLIASQVPKTIIGGEGQNEGPSAEYAFNYQVDNSLERERGTRLNSGMGGRK